MRLRNYEVFGKNSLDLPNYPRGRYEIVIGQGERSVTAGFVVEDGKSVRFVWLPW
ncbi:MAG: hypothetical protein KAI24_07050 [Planctomycetes bacterium]|nr:hypothetical protein [Planctomycetota bacterium]